MLTNLYTLFLQCTPPLPTQATNGGELPPWPEPTPIPTECTTGIVLGDLTVRANQDSLIEILLCIVIIMLIVWLFIERDRNK